MPTTQPGGPLGAKAQPLEVYATLSQKPSENVSATTTTEGREAVERPVVTRACTSPELATPNGLRSSSSSIKKHTLSVGMVLTFIAFVVPIGVEFLLAVFKIRVLLV